MFQTQPKRHPLYTKLKCFYGTHYRNFEISYNGDCPLIENYLERAYLTQWRALNQYERVLALRFDLRFPFWMPDGELGNDNRKISLFFRHLNEEIDKARTKYPTTVRYVWCREQEGSGKPHYHVMLYLNYNAFSRIGRIKPSYGGGYEGNCMYHRIARSWAKALSVMSCDVEGLVEPGRKAFEGNFFDTCLHRDDWMAQDEAFFRVSYLCKAHTKPFSQGVQVFNTSRI
ncbi:inovirus-type Gp2 protein [Salinicola lusitanus]|uniref:Inovirus-type Gp2 protein n=1 Tax=Salinicola lusitanus TaxID=1949085 RepID=A0ABZ3CWU2_9GAMM